MKTETPETDAEWGVWPYAGPGVHVNFARRLERERNEARKSAKEALELLQRAVNDSAGRHHYAVSEAIAKLQLF